MTLFEESLALLDKRINSGQFSKSNFKFVYMADCWAGAAPERTGNNMLLEKGLRAAQKYNPLFILFGGDAVWEGTRENHSKFLSLIKKNVPDIPVFVVPGNHETYGDKSLNNFQELIGPANFLLDKALFDLTVIGLNNTPKGFADPETNQSLAFLEKSLAGKRSLSFVMMHVPPKYGKWAVDKKPWNDHTFDNQYGLNRFLDIMKKYTVKRVLVGHIHDLDQQTINNNRYVISGGAGSTMYTEKPHHIVIFKVYKGKVTGYPYDFEHNKFL